MSTDSTEFYRNLLGQHTDLSLTELVIHTTDFEVINNLLPGPSDALKDILIRHLLQLKNMDHLLVPNITIHETLDIIFPLPDTQVSLVHPVKLTINNLRLKQIDQVILVGSKYTMQPGYISNAMLAVGITCHYPASQDVNLIDGYRRSIYNRTATPAMIHDFMTLLENYSQNMTVVLACTEFSMVYDGSIKNIIDMARVQINSLRFK